MESLLVSNIYHTSAWIAQTDFTGFCAKSLLNSEVMKTYRLSLPQRVDAIWARKRSTALM